MKINDILLTENTDQLNVAEGVNHSALQNWDEMDANQKTKALQQAGFKTPFRQYNWSDKEGHGQYTWDGWSSEELDDILHAAKVKELDQADELTMSASDRRGLQRQAKQDFEAQRQQLHKEKMEMERFAWEKANTEAERKHEIAKIEKEYLHDLRKLQMGHQQDMEKILHADTHELNKMKAEFNMRQAEREKENVQEPATQQAAQNTNGQNFDQDTGAPLKPQQSDQWHTSQQVGYTPGKPGPDVTDVEVKPNKPFALGNDTKKESIESSRAVDAKGRTQAQWARLVMSKFPGAKITQAKMIDGPMQATLPDGRKIGWNKVKQSGASPTQQSNQQGVSEADRLPRPDNWKPPVPAPRPRLAPQKRLEIGDIIGFAPQNHDHTSSGKVFKAEVLEIGERLGRSGVLLKLLNPEDVAANGGNPTMKVSSIVSKIQNPYVEPAQQGMTEEDTLNKYRQRVQSQGFTDSPEERNADRLERKRRHNAALDKISRISGLGGEEEAKHKAQQRMARDEYDTQRRKDDDEDTRKTFDMFRDRLNRMQYKNQRDVDPEQLKKISDIKYTPIREDAGEMTPNWAKYVLDQIYNSNGDVTLTDLFDEGIPGLHAMFMDIAQQHGLDPEEDFEDVQHELTLELEDLIKGGHDIDEGNKRSEADYGNDYQDMVARVKKLAGLGPLKTVYDPQKRVYKNVPVAQQPAQQPKKER
jgi:hypothetical protein